MGRLTRRAEADGVKAVWYGKRDVFLEGEVGYAEADKLAHYEDLEEQGRLIEQKHGKWEECDWVFYDGYDECVHIPKGAFVCTNCRHAFKKGKLEIRNYCPHCGAKMEPKELEGDKE